MVVLRQALSNHFLKWWAGEVLDSIADRRLSSGSMPDRATPPSPIQRMHAALTMAWRRWRGMGEALELAQNAYDEIRDAQEQEDEEAGRPTTFESRSD
jgi:hypothetical protein